MIVDNSASLIIASETHTAAAVTGALGMSPTSIRHGVPIGGG